MTIVSAEVWSDIHHGFITDDKGAIKKVINIDSVYTSIDNILRTRQGERFFLPEFGSRLFEMLFEGIDKDLLDEIATDIRDKIVEWDDRVIVNSLDFESYPDRNEINIQISFSVRGYDNIFQYSKTLTQGG